MPQVLPSRVQKVGSVSGGQAHAPPPVQTAGVVQVPQLATVRDTPQASLAVAAPQLLPRRAQKA